MCSKGHDLTFPRTANAYTRHAWIKWVHTSRVARLFRPGPNFIFVEICYYINWFVVSQRWYYKTNGPRAPPNEEFLWIARAILLYTKTYNQLIILNLLTSCERDGVGFVYILLGWFFVRTTRVIYYSLVIVTV